MHVYLKNLGAEGNQQHNAKSTSNRWGHHCPYIAANLDRVGLFDISPDIAVTREISSQVVQRLPCQHHRVVRRAIEVGPMHWLKLSDDLGRR